MNRSLTISITPEGRLDLKGDEFTIGEITAIATELQRFVGQQKIAFAPKEVPNGTSGENIEPKTESMPSVPATFGGKSKRK